VAAPHKSSELWTNEQEVYKTRRSSGAKQLEANVITCFIRYFVNPGKLAEFEAYARIWVPLIQKYGGSHHGYFMPVDTPQSAAFSFAGIGEEGPKNVAIAMFSFPTIEDYDSYRERVKNDPDCVRATAIRDDSQCFTKYERRFVSRIS
jgi:hypothetical protein